LLGSQGLLRNNTFLIALFAAFSVFQFFAYASVTHALEALTAGGVSPLWALFDVAARNERRDRPVLLLAAVQQRLAGSRGSFCRARW